MPAYNFKPEFAEAVRTGRKCQTIRKTCKGAKIGGRAVLYTGQRTKACEKLGEGVITAIEIIQIDRTRWGSPFVRLGSNGYLLLKEREAIAVADGFDSAENMVAWFENQYGALPFHGVVHKWRLK